MKTFLEYLLERRLPVSTKQFRALQSSTWELTLGQKLPIHVSTRVLQSLGGTKPILAVHITSTSLKRYEGIKAMQGTQKGLSTSTIIADSSQIKSGIASGGGSVYLLKGQPLIGSIKDIYSVTDKDGMRFVFGDNIIENSKYKKIKKDFDKMHVESLRKSLPKHALEQIEDATNDEEFKAILKWELTTGDLKNDQQLKRIVTKVYFDFISKFIGKYKKEIMDGLAYELAIRGQYQGSHSDTEAPNEIILNKFTIEAVYLLDPENTRYELDRTDARSPKEIFDELVDELQADRVLYSVHDSPSDIVYDVNDLMYDVNSKNYPLRTPKGPLF